MAAVSSSLGAKRSPDREVEEEETEQKRPALTDDSSGSQNSSEPSLLSAFQLRPSSLKAPSIKLQTGTQDEGGPSIVSAGFSLTNQRSSITLGFSARQQLEQWSTLHSLGSQSEREGSSAPVSDGARPTTMSLTLASPSTDSCPAEGERIFGSNFEKIVATEGATKKDCATDTETRHILGANLAEKVSQLGQGQGSAKSSDSECKVDASEKKDEKVQDSSKVEDEEESPTESGPPLPSIEAVFGDDHLFKPRLVPTLPEFVHQTGEENDMVVVHIQAKLYMFDSETQNWIEKGRGVISLNDICQSSSEGIFQSRLVMRMAGSRRLLLNSNMWTEMSCEKVNAKSIRFTGQDVDSGSIRIFLIKGDTRNISNLYSAMEKRVLAMRRACGRASDESSQSEDDSDCRRMLQSGATPGAEETEHADQAKDSSSQPPSSVAGEGEGELARSTQQEEDSKDVSKDDQQPD